MKNKIKLNANKGLVILSQEEFLQIFIDLNDVHKTAKLTNDLVIELGAKINAIAKNHKMFK